MPGWEIFSQREAASTSSIGGLLEDVMAPVPLAKSHASDSHPSWVNDSHLCCLVLLAVRPVTQAPWHRRFLHGRSGGPLYLWPLALRLRRPLTHISSSSSSIDRPALSHRNGCKSKKTSDVFFCSPCDDFICIFQQQLVATFQSTPPSIPPTPTFWSTSWWTGRRPFTECCSIISQLLWKIAPSKSIIISSHFPLSATSARRRSFRTGPFLSDSRVPLVINSAICLPVDFWRQAAPFIFSFFHRLKMSRKYIDSRPGLF